MKVKLVCRRKHPCLKVMSNWVADKVMNQRKIWQNRIHPTLTQERGKESYLREWCRGGGRGKRAGLLGQLYRDRLQRENKLDTGEDRRSQKMRRSQKIRTDCHSMKPSRAIQERQREKPDWVSQLERSLSQSSWVGQAARAQKEQEMVSIFSSKS